MSLDVHPPRAARKPGRWRRWYPLYRLLQPARHFALASIGQGGFGGLVRGRPPGALLLRMFVPGWVQFYTGRVVHGRIMLWGYLATLLLGLLFVGTFFGSVLLGAALALHASSVLEFIFASTDRWRLRLAYATLCLGAIAVVVYVPARWAVGQVASPQRIVRTTPPFHAGDVILYNPSAYGRSAPRVGDVVVYQIPEGRLTGTRGAVLVVTGPRIDRVLAGPGQEVRCEGGEIWVDGQPSAWLPLNPERSPGDLTMTIPENHCFIVPSTDPVIPQGSFGGFAMVPASRVLGKVYLRTQPLWRWGFLR